MLRLLILNLIFNFFDSVFKYTCQSDSCYLRISPAKERQTSPEVCTFLLRGILFFHTEIHRIFYYGSIIVVLKKGKIMAQIGKIC